ncbi:MAG: HAMP domain-containing histidine kinase [Euzebyales bacterium]|nr:HAMP domain-containing histidine kinase [Euzebyales bacterium]
MVATTEPSLRAAEQTADEADEVRLPWWRQALSSARFRILGWYIALLALALVASTLAVRQILLVRLDERINEELNQEVDELNRLAQGRDPRTGERFASVEPLFKLFLSRNIPAQAETMSTFVEGQRFRRSTQRAPVNLFEDESLTSRWANVTESQLGSVDTAAGRVDYAAVPVRVAARQGTSHGVFVVAEFYDMQRREVDEVVRVAAGVGFATLVIASLLAWAVAGRILAPVRLVTDTARAISDTDLKRRIPVDGDDEISRLAATFNAMLDRLENAFSTQRDFVDDAGHELRTPITIIRGHLELLGDDPQERRETVAIVTDELDRMNRMVDDLLVLAKAERPDFLNLETVDLGALTDDLLVKAGALGRRSWRLDSRAERRIVADRQRLTQAIVQLAQNATQHTQQGDTVAIGSAAANGEARLWVRDNGSGVSAEDRDRIFERFSRAAASRRRSEGAGLGLSIVRAIASAHRGRVELDSRPGEGATFTVVVPIDPERPQEDR